MLNIVLRAVRIRLNNGEKLEDVLASYPKLTQGQVDLIKQDLFNELEDKQ